MIASPFGMFAVFWDGPDGVLVFLPRPSLLHITLLEYLALVIEKIGKGYKLVSKSRAEKYHNQSFV
jgi:hypothetical protein